jgi:adenylate cyclase
LLRQALARRVSKEVLQEILNNPSSYLNQLGGIRKDVTVLFSDLRGFTTLSENSDPDALVSQLNQYFDIMVGVIQGDRGMVDKFIGDAIMAVWGSVPTLGGSEGSPLAVAAALRMSRALPKLNTRWKEEGSPELAMGLGIHRGEAVTGNVGSEKRLELTVIGDTVNLAARLEGVTKMYGVEIVISEVVANDLGEGWIVRPLDRVQVKGRSASAGIFEPLAMPGDDEDILRPAIAKAERYASAFELYLSRQFENATEAFDEFLEKYPGDKPAEKLAQRCREYLQSPPEESWDGGVPLDSK